MGYLDSICPLDAEKRKLRISIAAKLMQVEGLCPYLGLNDPDQADTLTRGFAWDRCGPQLLSTLLKFRRTHHRVVRSCTELEEGPHRNF
jgi:uncharacterized Ntn-hydrolase superfamily protein